VRNKGREYERVSKTGEKENVKCHRTLKDYKFIKYCITDKKPQKTINEIKKKIIQPLFLIPPTTILYHFCSTLSYFGCLYAWPLFNIIVKIVIFKSSSHANKAFPLFVPTLRETDRERRGHHLDCSWVRLNERSIPLSSSSLLRWMNELHFTEINGDSVTLYLSRFSDANANFTFVQQIL